MLVRLVRSSRKTTTVLSFATVSSRASWDALVRWLRRSRGLGDADEIVSPPSATKTNAVLASARRQTDEAGESCPICTCYYKSVNVTTCCQFKICSECHARHVNSFAFRKKGTRAFGGPRRRNSYRDRIFDALGMPIRRRNASSEEATSDNETDVRVLQKRRYTVMYLGVRTRKERERDAEEKRRIDTSLALPKLRVRERQDEGDLCFVGGEDEEKRRSGVRWLRCQRLGRRIRNGEISGGRWESESERGCGVRKF